MKRIIFVSRDYLGSKGTRDKKVWAATFHNSIGGDGAQGESRKECTAAACPYDADCLLGQTLSQSQLTCTYNYTMCLERAYPSVSVSMPLWLREYLPDTRLADNP